MGLPAQCSDVVMKAEIRRGVEAAGDGAAGADLARHGQDAAAHGEPIALGKFLAAVEARERHALESRPAKVMTPYPMSIQHPLDIAVWPRSFCRAHTRCAPPMAARLYAWTNSSLPYG